MTDRKKIKVAIFPGDGIGAEVTQAAIPILDYFNLPLQLTYGEIGWSCWTTEGTPIPDRSWKLIHESDVILLGATTSKPKREAQLELPLSLQKSPLNYISPIVQLRQSLDLFANVRPCFSLDKRERPFHFCIIRENTEGLYAGMDYYPLPDILHGFIQQHPSWQRISAADASCSLRLQSKKSLLRLFQFAFQSAEQQNMHRVTLADKPNVLRNSSVLSREIFEFVAAQYPNIQADILNVDAVGLWLVRRPEQFGIIVAENMFGDILSDVGAGVMGGLGLAPSANIGTHKCYFEPVHGSAPNIPTNKANPSAMFLTISMLLKHLGFSEHADWIHQAVISTIQHHRHVTYDLGGTASTLEMASAIIEQCIKE